MKRTYEITGFNKHDVYCYAVIEARDESEAINKAINKGIVTEIKVEEN